MKRWATRVIAAVLTVGLLAGCGGMSPAGGSKSYKACMATDIGGLNDDSFNAAAYRGLQNLEKDHGFQIQAIESKRNEDYEVNFRTLMDQKCDIIWGIGFLMTDAIAKMADEHPNQKWGIIDGVVEKPNVASVIFKEEEGSFLMGIIAAKTTQTKKVGFVGGMDIDVIHHFDGGFAAGVKAVDPSIQVIRVYSGSFVDSAKGKEVALSIFSQGADVVFHAAGGTGQGVIEAAAEQKKFAIGVDSDQNHLAPDYVISSMMKRVDVAVYTVSKQAQDGKFPGGQLSNLGLKEDGVGYSGTTLWPKMPGDTKALVDKWAQAIKDGKATIPNSYEKFQSWAVPQI